MSMDQFDVIGIGTEQKYEDYVAGWFYRIKYNVKVIYSSIEEVS